MRIILYPHRIQWFMSVNCPSIFKRLFLNTMILIAFFLTRERGSAVRFDAFCGQKKPTEVSF